MRSPAVAVAVLLIAGSLTGACTKSEILGVWSGEDAEAKRHTLSFRHGGRASWAIEGDGETQSYEIRYTFDDDPTPHHLDLTGFTSGQLKDKTLYCILELQGADTFRMDCEPGAPGEEGESVRPADFGQNALLYLKVK
jgi:hypothetical protein